MKVAAVVAGFLVLGFIGYLVMPSSSSTGEQFYSVNVTARINQQIPLGTLTGGILPKWTLDQVNYDVVGETRNWELITEKASFWRENTMVEFCIMNSDGQGTEECQREREGFTISLGEQRVSSETIPYVVKGEHELVVKLYVEGELEAHHREVITV